MPKCGRYAASAHPNGRCSEYHREGRLRRWLQAKDDVQAAYGRVGAGRDCPAYHNQGVRDYGKKAAA